MIRHISLTQVAPGYGNLRPGQNREAADRAENFENCSKVKDAGANIIVSGSTIFKENKGDLKKNIEILSILERLESKDFTKMNSMEILGINMLKLMQEEDN